MEAFRPPNQLQFVNNVSENWMLWRQQLENYMTATDKITRKDNVKVAVLLNLIGTEGLQIYNTFDFEDPSDKLSYNKVIERFENYCSPKKNLVYEHYKFFSRSQHDEETTDQFVTELKKMAATCEFAERDVMLRDRLVLGTKHKTLQEKMLREPDLSLDKAMQYSQAFEITKQQLKDIQKNQIAEVETVYRKDKWNKPTRDPQSSTDTTKKKSNCIKCGYIHAYRKCPAFGKTCNRCLKTNHFAAMCKNKVAQAIDMEDDPDSTNEVSDIVVWEVSTKKNKNWYELFYIENKPVSLKIDSGSEVNILNINAYDIVKNKLITKSKNKLLAYSGHPISVLGTTMLKVEAFGRVMNLEFYLITEGLSHSILGLEAAIKFGLINLNKRINEVYMKDLDLLLAKYRSVFEGNGKLKHKYKIKLKANSIPKSAPPRKIPLAIQEEVKQEIKSMVDRGILEPVTEPTQWASPIVIVIKPKKKIRICMDPRSLNENIIRERCWIPTPETVFAQLSRAKYFTVLDASNAFHQIPLDYHSSMLCTIATPFGRYRYKRLPYGLSSAPEVFQRAISDMLEGIPGTINYIDDILVHGATKEEHDERLAQVLDRVEKSGLKLSKDKMQLAVERIHYLGHIISAGGVEVDPGKIEAINKIPRPETKKDLQRFLGLITYLAKYIPNLSQRSAPLRQLLSKNVEWTWEPSGPEEAAFTDLKQLISTPPLLRHFDTKEAVTLSVDASSYGIGAILLQNNAPVAYASATLTQPQTRYSQIEKELLAVVYACEHFNYFVFGREITVQTDHKPLLAIVKKPIDEITPRLQRLVLRLLRYTVKLVHVPGKNLTAADALSRDPNICPVIADYLNEIMVVCPIQLSTSKRMQQLIKETKEDSELSKIMAYCDLGWPLKQKHMPVPLRKYWNNNTSYHHSEGLLYKGNAIVVPKSLRKELLRAAHSTHQGYGSCKSRITEALYWPGMLTDLKELIMVCDTCLKYSKSNLKETLKPHEIPTLPWQKLGIDFKTDGELNYLVIIDYFSKFIVVNRIPDKTAKSVVLALKNVFAINGLPHTIFSDNGPPFDATQYIKFLDDYDIVKNTSSPLYPQSNGMVERAIQDVKAMIQKAVHTGEDLMQAVLNFNMTPKQGTKTPAAILMGRNLRTLIPTSPALLKPAHDTTNHYNQLMKNASDMAKSRKDRHLQTLVPGQPIYIQKSLRHWQPGHVIQDLKNNSYDLLTDRGNVIRRNRFHLKPRPVPTAQEDTPTTKHCQTGLHPDRPQSELKPTITPKKTYIDPEMKNMLLACESPPPQEVPLNPEGKNNISLTIQNSRDINHSATEDPRPTTTRSGRLVIRPTKMNV